VSALESAHFNAQTLAALSNSQRVLRQIHRDLNITNVDAILDDIREQIENAQVVSEAISTPLDGDTIDEVSLDIAAI
jgi:charged multivesicular body protein 4